MCDNRVQVSGFSFSSELLQGPQLVSLSGPSRFSSVQLVCPLLVRRGAGSPVVSPAGKAGKGGGPHSGPKQNPGVSVPLW